MEISSCGGKDEDVVSVDELREDAYRVLEPGLVLAVLPGQVVPTDDLPAVPGTQGHTEISRTRCSG